MKCEQVNLISSNYFGKKQDKAQNNNQLNFGVVTPPDALPNANIYNDLFSPQKTSKKIKNKTVTGGSKLTAGRFSAHLAFASMFLAAISFLPFIRKH